MAGAEAMKPLVSEAPCCRPSDHQAEHVSLNADSPVGAGVIRCANPPHDNRAQCTNVSGPLASTEMHPLDSSIANCKGTARGQDHLPLQP